MPSFLIRENGRPDRVYPIDLPKVVIGRARNAQLVLPNVSVSRRHAQVVRSGASYTLVDLESQNGTRINGHPVKRADLRPGDEVQVGKYLLRFQVDQAYGAQPWSAENARVNSTVTDFVDMGALDQMRRSFLLRDKARIFPHHTPAKSWLIGQQPLYFGGRDGVPCDGIGFGRLASIAWNGRSHVLERVSRLARISIQGRYISQVTLRQGDRFAIGKSLFDYGVPDEE